MVPIWLMNALPYVTQTEAAKSRLVARAQRPQLYWATLSGLTPLAIMLQTQLITKQQSMFIIIAMIASYGICYWRFKVRLQGITGDFLGASQQISECAILIGLAWTVTG